VAGRSCLARTGAIGVIGDGLGFPEPAAADEASLAPVPLGTSESISQADARISYVLPSSGQVRVSVFNLQGREVRRLTEGSAESGEHQVSWDGRNETGRELPAGAYFVRVQTTHGASTTKVTLTRR
jgi:flagellar hook assembly protein FlgD